MPDGFGQWGPGGWGQWGPGPWRPGQWGPGPWRPGGWCPPGAICPRNMSPYDGYGRSGPGRPWWGSDDFDD